MHDAIFDATVAELLENGYPRLTMDRVAERAHTSKASLYRRWSNKVDLVLGALIHRFPSDDELPDTGELRADLVTLLHHMATVMTGPVGEIVKGMLLDASADVKIGIQARQQFVDRRDEMFLTILRRWAQRGEVRTEALTHRVASVGPCLLRDSFLLHRSPIPDQVIAEIVDTVLVPLVSVRTRTEPG